MRRNRLVIAGLLLLWIIGVVEVGADDTFYTYVDDKGTTVITNKWESIPEQYRARAKLMQKPPALPGQGAGTMVTQATEGLKEMVSMPEVKFAGLSEHQSQVLILGFAAAVLMGAIMLMSGNPAIRFLMRWLLVLLAIGMTASMYFSDGGGGLMPKAKGAATNLQRAQEGKDTQVKELETAPREP
jgi:hypothetical protein